MPDITIQSSRAVFAQDEHPILSVVIPVHNEEEILEEQTEKLVEYTQHLTAEAEILFVENGSTDKTLCVIKELQKEYDCIRLKKLKKADYSTAVIEGVKAAKGKYSIIMGIDYVDLEVLGRCLHALKNSDIVICSKNRGVDGRPIISRLTNKCYNILVRLFFGLKYSDIEGYHGYNNERIRPIISDIETKAHLCNLWVLVKARKAALQVEEVPLTVYERRQSKFMKLTSLPYLAAISLVECIKLKSRGY